MQVETCHFRHRLTLIQLVVTRSLIRCQTRKANATVFDDLIMSYSCNLEKHKSHVSLKRRDWQNFINRLIKPVTQEKKKKKAKKKRESRSQPVHALGLTRAFVSEFCRIQPYYGTSITLCMCRLARLGSSCTEVIYCETRY